MGYAREALRQALVNLEAIPAPAGTLPVVMGAGWSGVLLHEAVGHGLEGDFNRKGSSAYSGRIGEKVASSLCTIVDDGTLAGRRGSLSVDDEGTPSNCNVLIENGVLKGYMQDKLNARLMGVARTGNGRRESYAHLPMPRMTNTYMLAGESDPQEIIASVEKGIYCANLGGGQVDITSGKFVFSTSEAYLIENGRITTPVKGATLIGNGPEAMSRVSMVGNDLALDSGVGTCGKDGQSVPVGVGQPTLKIDAITVGGTGAGGLARAPARRNLAQAALGFVQFADVLEHFACGGRRFVVRGLVLGVADQAAQVLAIALGELPDEGVERCVAAGDQLVAPTFEGMETFVVLAGGGVHLVDEGDDGVHVLVAHQFADVLDMPFAGDVRLVLRRLEQRLA